MIDKIPFLTPYNAKCKILISSEEIEDGHEVLEEIYSGPCFFTQNTKRVQNKEGLWVPLAGVVQIQGDISKEHLVLSGKISVNDSEYFTFRGTKRRNPDGSIHHTYIELGVD